MRRWVRTSHLLPTPMIRCRDIPCYGGKFCELRLSLLSETLPPNIFRYRCQSSWAYLSEIHHVSRRWTVEPEVVSPSVCMCYVGCVDIRGLG